MEKLPVNIFHVIQQCMEGKFPEELKLLYQVQYRDKVPWTEFPRWARPDLVTEGCHEG